MSDYLRFAKKINRAAAQAEKENGGIRDNRAAYARFRNRVDEDERRSEESKDERADKLLQAAQRYLYNSKRLDDEALKAEAVKINAERLSIENSAGEISDSVSEKLNRAADAFNRAENERLRRIQAENELVRQNLAKYDLFRQRAEEGDISVALNDRSRENYKVAKKISSRKGRENIGENSMFANSEEALRYVNAYEKAQQAAKSIRKSVRKEPEPKRTAEEYNSRIAEYDRLRQNADFAEKAMAGELPAYTPTGIYTDAQWAAMYLNADEQHRKIMEAQDGALASRSFLQAVNEEQKQTFNYLRATQGDEAAMRYIDELQPLLTRQDYQTQEEAARELAERDPVGATMLSVYQAPAKGLDFIGAAFDPITGAGSDALGNVRTATYTPARLSGDIREQVMADIGDATGNKEGFFSGTNAAKIGYGAATSLADNWMNMLVTGGNKTATLALLGMGAATDAYYDGLDRGLSNGQALAQGVAAGAIEAATEKIGIDNLFKLIKGGKKPFAKAIVGALKQAGAEGAEEGLSNIGNLLYDTLANGDKSNIKTTYEAYRKDGATEKEARQNTARDLVRQLGEDILAGAISGAASGGIGTGIGAATGADTQTQSAEPQTAAEQAAEAENAAQNQLESPRAAQEQDRISRAAAEVVRNENQERTEDRTERELDLGDGARAIKAEVAETHEPINIVKGVSSVKDGRVYVATNAGEIAADELIFGDEGKANSLSELYSSADVFDTKTANDYVKGYDGKTSVKQYYLDYAKIVNAIAEGNENRALDVMERSRISLAAQQSAVAAGNRLAQENKSAGVINRAGRALTAQETEQTEALDVFGKAIGRRIIIDESIDTDIGGKVVKSGANAYFDTRTNEYHIALDAVGGASVYLAAHESIHDIAKNNAAGYDKVRRVTLDALKKNGQDTEALIKEAQQREGSTRQAAEEEVIANTIPAIFRDADMRQKFAEAMAAEDADTRSAFEKFIDKVKELLDNAYNALKKTKSFKQMQAVENDRQSLEAMMDAYTEALKGRENITGEDGKRYSLNPNFEAEYDAWDKINPSVQFEIGITSEALQYIGLNKRKIYWSGANIIHAKKHPEMTDSVIKKVPTIIEKPMIVMESKTVSNRLTLFGELLVEKNGKEVPVLAILEMTKNEKGRAEINDYVIVVNAYGKDSNPQKLIDTSRILWVESDNSKVQTWLTHTRLQLPVSVKSGLNGRISSVNNSISENSEKSNPQIKYSLKDDAEVTELIDENESLRERIDEQDAIIAELRRQMKPTETRRNERSQIMRYARELKKQYGSELEADFIADTLDEMYAEMMSKEPNDMRIRQLGVGLARELISSGQMLDTAHEDAFEPIRKGLRKFEFSLSDVQKAEIAQMTGLKYGQFRQRMLSKLNIKNDAKSLDSVWPELVEASGGLLDINANEGDQITALYELADYAQKRYISPIAETGLSLNEAAADLFIEMRDRHFDMRNAKGTYADKMLERIKAAKEKGYIQRRDALLKQKEQYEKRIASAKSREEAARLAYKAYRERRRNTASHSRGAERVKKHAAALAKLLSDPNEKKGAYIPDKFKKSIMGLLEVIDFTNKKEDSKAAEQWQQKLKDIKNEIAYLEEHPTEAGELMVGGGSFKPVVITSRIDALIAGGKKSIGKLTGEELNDLADLLKITRHAIRNSVNTFMQGRYSNVETMRRGIVQYGNERKGKYKNTPFVAGGKFRVDQLDSFTYGDLMGDVGKAISKNLSDAQNMMFSRIREASEMFEGVKENHKKQLNASTMNKWNTKREVFKFASGQTGLLTAANRMEIYVISRRPQGLQHLLGGGIEIDERKPGATEPKYETYLLTESDIRAIEKSLTSVQKEVALAMQNFLSKTASGWGNETSMRLYGVRLFNEPIYWRLKPAKSGYTNRKGELMDSKWQKMYAAMNEGFTKRTNPYANNALSINSIFDSFGEHAAEMARYSTLDPIVDGLNKWLNAVERDADSGKPIPGTDVRSAIRKVCGEPGVDYIQDLIMDINGMKRGEAGGIDRFLGNVLSAYKRASVAAKIRVIIQQPTAVVRAASEINPAYLAGGTFAGKKTIQEMQAHSPIAWWKSNGRFDIGVSGSVTAIITGETKPIQRLSDTAMAAAGLADDYAWAVLWNACKAEYRRNNKLSVGTKLTSEQLSEVNERFTEIVNRTQVVDTILHRSGNMRSSSLSTKQYTAFMSEPTKIYNMLVSKGIEMQNAKTTEEKKQAVAGIMRTAAAFAASAVLNSIVKSLWDAARKRNKEEEFSEQLLKTFRDNAADELNLLNLMPIVSDVWEVAESILSSEAKNNDWMDFWPGLKDYFSEKTSYSNETMLAQALGRVNTLYTQLSQMGDENRGHTWYALASTAANSISYITGLPFAGLISNFEGIYQAITGTDPKHRNSKKENYDAMRDALAEGNDEEYNRLRESVYKQEEQDVNAEYEEDPEAFEKEYKGKTAKEVIDDNISQGIKSSAGRKYKQSTLDAFNSGEAEYKKAVKDLAKYGIDEGYIRAQWISPEYKYDYLKNRNDSLEQKLLYAGYTEDDLMGWVTTEYREDAKIKYAEGDDDAIAEYVKNLKGEGKEEQSIWTSVNGMFRDKYIELWKEGDTEGAKEIEDMLKALKLRGKNGYYADADFFQGWRDAAKEE